MLIQKYSEKWKTNFDALKEIFEKTISNVKISIEHIGSTAVPNLDAKDILDIDIVYFDLYDFQKIKVYLETLGYCHYGNQGIIDREVFKRINTNHPILDTIPHHLYVCPNHSQELKKHILFRNYLRKNEFARDEYQDLKYKIAQEAKQDKKKYAYMKEIKATKFITNVIDLANKLEPNFFSD